MAVSGKVSAGTSQRAARSSAVCRSGILSRSVSAITRRTLQKLALLQSVWSPPARPGSWVRAFCLICLCAGWVCGGKWGCGAAIRARRMPSHNTLGTLNEAARHHLLQALHQAGFGGFSFRGCCPAHFRSPNDSPAGRIEIIAHAVGWRGRCGGCHADHRNRQVNTICNLLPIHQRRLKSPC